jgi:hypothetical protein
MMRVFSPLMEVLPQVQRRLWPELRPARDLGLVLYGGTAIALQLGHRSSIDFDLFTEHPLDPVAIREAIPFLSRAIVLQEQPDKLSVQVPAEDASDRYVNVSFFGRIAIGRVGEPLLTDDGTLVIASLDDLMATKLKVLLQRIEAKDYQDIAAMVEAGVSVERGLASARVMYGPAFQPSESLKALVYFEGGDLHTLSPNTMQTLIDAVRFVGDPLQARILSRSLSG